MQALGRRLEIIGHHEVNLHLAPDAFPEALHDLLRPLHLFAAGQQLLAVVPGPAVVLGVGQFHVVGAQPQRHLQNLLHVIDVEPVQHHVEHHGIVVLLDQSRDLRFQIEGARAAQKVVHLPRAVLEGELNVIQPGLLQGMQTRFVQAHAGGDEIACRTRAGAPPPRSISRSSRDSGSPPDRPSCTAPRARASRSTRIQSSVSSSAAVFAKSVGL